MSSRYVHNNGQFQQQTLGFDLNRTVQRYLHDAGYLTGHAGTFLHRLDLSVEAPHAPSIAEPRYASATVPAHQPDPSYMEARAGRQAAVRPQPEPDRGGGPGPAWP